MREVMIWDFHNMPRRHSFVWTWNQNNMMITTSFFHICGKSLIFFLKQKLFRKIISAFISVPVISNKIFLFSLDQEYLNVIKVLKLDSLCKQLRKEMNVFFLKLKSLWESWVIFLLHSPALHSWQHILPWQTGSHCQACIMQVWHVSRSVNISFRFKATCV